MTRFPDWEARLHRFLDARRHTPFAIGTADCCTFAADAVLKMTGTDPMEPWRGTYETKADAIEMVEAFGGLPRFLGVVLGPQIPVAEAMTGDVALVIPGGETTERLAAAVVVNEVAVAQGAAGTVAIPMARAVAAYRVPMGEG